MKKHTVITVGFLMAPLCAAIVLLTIEVVIKGQVRLISTVRWALGWTAVLYFYSMVATLVIGLPAFLVLNRISQVTWWSATAVGIFCGALMGGIFGNLSLPYLMAGGLSGFVFWVIWRCG